MRLDTKAIIHFAKDVITKELKAIEIVRDIIGEDFVKAIEILLSCPGKVVVIGMGKSGNIAQKIAATLRSTGTLAIYLNPAEAVHGDLGIVSDKDCTLVLSKSGETREVINILPYMLRRNIPIISMTASRESQLAKSSDVVIYIGDFEEACPMNLAPTSSTTAMLVLGDAIAVTLMWLKGFTEEQFRQYHPGGMLGYKLKPIKEVMQTRRLPILSLIHI